MINALKNPTVAALHAAFIELEDLSAAERDELLAGFDGELADIRLLTGNAWLSDQKRKDFDPRAAAELFADLAERALAWGHRRLVADCVVARSVVLDEYAGDAEAAMRAIDDGETRLGTQIELTRQRAKVLHRSGRDVEAAALHTVVAEQLPVDDRVEQAFAMREAAIGAARLGDWPKAVEYYARARSAAEPGDGDMTVMATGLAGDLAWAQAHSGRIGEAVSSLKTALGRTAGYTIEQSI